MAAPNRFVCATVSKDGILLVRFFSDKDARDYYGDMCRWSDAIRIVRSKLKVATSYSDAGEQLSTYFNATGVYVDTTILALGLEPVKI